MKITTTETNGKHFATVSAGDRIAFRTPGYYTEDMAQADARCWVAFHGKDVMPTYTLSMEPIDSGTGAMPLKGSYATKAEAWEAVKRTFYNEPVTVFEDGKPVATFNWMFKTADEPEPNRPGYVRRVRDLCKWTRKGWEVTGVQSVGAGKERFIRVVAV